jgi:four helix bundle protein
MLQPQGGMALSNFRTYQLALQFTWMAESFESPAHLRDQLSRASSSIALNLAEGSAKPTSRDRAKFYFIALGSLRECEAILEVLRIKPTHPSRELCDKLAAHVMQLLRSEGALRRSSSQTPTPNAERRTPYVERQTQTPTSNPSANADSNKANED